jgi:hypothetical protein
MGRRDFDARVLLKKNLILRAYDDDEREDTQISKRYARLTCGL